MIEIRYSHSIPSFSSSLFYIFLFLLTFHDLFGLTILNVQAFIAPDEVLDLYRNSYNLKTLGTRSSSSETLP